MRANKVRVLGKPKLLLYIQAIKNRAEVYHHIGEYQKSINDYKKAIFHSTQDFQKKHPLLFAEMEIDRIGIIDHYQHNPHQALVLIAKIKRKFRKSNPKIYVKILKTLGNIFERRGQYAPAIWYYRKIPEVAKKLKGEVKRIEIGISYNNLGVIYQDIGKIEEAKIFYKKALKIFGRFKNKIGIGTTKNNLGILYFNEGNFTHALKYFNSYLETAQAIGYKMGIGIASGNIGLVHHCKNELERALENYQRGLSISEELGDKRGVSIAMVNIGSIYYDRANYDNAKKYYNRSLVISQKIGNQGVEGLALLGLGMVYVKLKQLNLAQTMTKKAEERFLEMDEQIKLSEVYTNFTEIYAERGNYDKAISYAIKAFDLARRTKAVEQMIIALRSHARVLFKRAKKNRNQVNDIRTAKNYLRKSIELAQKHKMYLELNKSLALKPA